MSRRRRRPVATLAGFALLAATLLGTGPAEAEGVPGTATIAELKGRVEFLRAGETAWTPATLGTRLAERDEIRAFAGGSTVLRLPDTSTLVLSENSRLVMTRMEFDAQQQTRNAIFHLVAGKVRAIVAKAALSLVRARQSNFAITTPTAVAAARGTDYVTVFNVARQSTSVTVLRDGEHRALTSGPPVSEVFPSENEAGYVVRLQDSEAADR